MECSTLAAVVPTALTNRICHESTNPQSPVAPISVSLETTVLFPLKWKINESCSKLGILTYSYSFLPA